MALLFVPPLTCPDLANHDGTGGLGATWQAREGGQQCYCPASYLVGWQAPGCAGGLHCAGLLRQQQQERPTVCLQLQCRRKKKGRSGRFGDYCLCWEGGCPNKSLER